MHGYTGRSDSLLTCTAASASRPYKNCSFVAVLAMYRSIVDEPSSSSLQVGKGCVGYGGNETDRHDIKVMHYLVGNNDSDIVLSLVNLGSALASTCTPAILAAASTASGGDRSQYDSKSFACICTICALSKVGSTARRNQLVALQWSHCERRF